MKRIHHCMGAASWHCKLYTPDLPAAQYPPGSVHGIPQVTRMSCFRSMIFQSSSAANSRQAAGTVHFLLHIHVWHRPRTCCNPTGYFLDSWCRRNGAKRTERKLSSVSTETTIRNRFLAVGFAASEKYSSK